MNIQKKNKQPSRAGRERVFRVEILEARALLTTAETFSGPSLTDLIQLARKGENTAPAGINRMLQALQTQLDSGPLADLKAGTIDGNGFATEVQDLETSYEQNVDQQLSPEFPHIDRLLKLQGQRVVADVISLNQQKSVGLLSSASLATQAQTAINSLTGGPIHSLGTPPSAYVARTQSFESELDTLVQSLSPTATTPLTIAQVSTTLTAEAEAYRSDLHAALQVTHPNISNIVDVAVNTLESTTNTIAQSNSSDAQSQLTSAIKAFDTAILDTTGLFGPQGLISRALLNHRVLSPNLTVSPAATTLGSVSGTATGGNASLMATLTSAVTHQGVSGKSISFTLDGAFVGTAVTDSSGVATLTGVPTNAAVGTVAGGVVASFAGDINDQSSHGSGDLTVS